VQVLNISEIVIPTNRQRKEFDEVQIVELAESIAKNGLIHPPVIRREADKWILVAGERRIKAITYLWKLGESLRVGETTYSEGQIPCTFLGNLDPLDAFEVELEENIRRLDLTWQEKAIATSQLYELRRLQAEARGDLPPTVSDIARELTDTPNHPSGYDSAVHASVREDLIVSKFLSDPDVSKAPTRREAVKILKRKETAQRNAEMGAELAGTLTSSAHTLLKGDCLEIMSTLPDESFDVILTDPPYGINAQDFGDSGGRATGGHFYDDSLDTWITLVRGLSTHSFRLAKARAHLYIFCDIDNYVSLRDIVASAGWKPFRTPIIWVNPTGMRAPWPQHGPQRKYQICLYAMKGDRNVTSLRPDVVSYTMDENLGHVAQKPIDVYVDLLKRSVNPGDTVLDPFCGSGVIFPAAHGLKVRATGIEIDNRAYAISAKRLASLGDGEPLW
jgi:DNA modification methylase